MKTLTAAVALILALPVAAQADAPPATADLAALYGCDAAAFTAVKNADGAILYWNNATCAGNPDGMTDEDTAAVLELVAAQSIDTAPEAVAD